MKRTKGSRFRKRPPRRAERLEVGQRILDPEDSRFGRVLDCACQYSHPKAPPIYSYLVRWEDGQINAISESALVGDNSLRPVD